MGSAAADSELDALKDAAEAQITASSNLVGHFAGLVATFCYNKCEALSERAFKAAASISPLTRTRAIDGSKVPCKLTIEAVAESHFKA